MKIATILFLIFIVLFFFLCNINTNSFSEANHLLKNEQYEQAIDKYQEASSEYENDKDTLSALYYNQGIAQYKKGNFESSEKCFQDANTQQQNRSWQAQTQKNLGDTIFRQAQKEKDELKSIETLEKSVFHYKDAHNLDSYDPIIENNLKNANLLLRYKKDQLKQNQQNSNDSKNKEDNKDKKDKQDNNEQEKKNNNNKNKNDCDGNCSNQNQQQNNDDKQQQDKQQQEQQNNDEQQNQQQNNDNQEQQENEQQENEQQQQQGNQEQQENEQQQGNQEQQQGNQEQENKNMQNEIDMNNMKEAYNILQEEIDHKQGRQINKRMRRPYVDKNW